MLNPRGLWCILGDFNSIRDPVERLGTCQKEIGGTNIKEFNDWIEEMEVHDVP